MAFSKTQSTLVKASFSERLVLSKLLKIASYFPDFQPNPYAAEAEPIIEAFAWRHNIWLSKGREYVTMTAYLHPKTVNAERLVMLGMLDTILYYVDDTMANDTQRTLDFPQAAKKEPIQLIKECFDVIQGGPIPEDNELIAPLLEVIAAFERVTPAGWIYQLLDSLRQHLEAGVTDHDSEVMGRVLTTNEYILLREVVSGMYAAIDMLSAARDIYPSYQQLVDLNIVEDFQQLKMYCVWIGSLTNDIFSYEKESILGTDFNLISNVMLNNPSLSFEEAVYQACEIVNDATDKFFFHSERIQAAIYDKQAASAINEYVIALTHQIAATWHWQISTDRYCSRTSPFAELCIVD